MPTIDNSLLTMAGVSPEYVADIAQQLPTMTAEGAECIADKVNGNYDSNLTQSNMPASLIGRTANGSILYISASAHWYVAEPEEVEVLLRRRIKQLGETFARHTRLLRFDSSEEARAREGVLKGETRRYQTLLGQLETLVGTRR